MEDLTIMQVLSAYVYTLILLGLTVAFGYFVAFIRFFYKCMHMKYDLRALNKAKAEGLDTDILKTLYHEIKAHTNKENAIEICKVITNFLRKNNS